MNIIRQHSNVKTMDNDRGGNEPAKNYMHMNVSHRRTNITSGTEYVVILFAKNMQQHMATNLLQPPL